MPDIRRKILEFAGIRPTRRPDLVIRYPSKFLESDHPVSGKESNPAHAYIDRSRGNFKRPYISYSREDLC